MDALTAAEVRETMQIADFAFMGLITEERLQSYTDDAVEEVCWLTGWTMAVVPTTLERTMTRTIGLMTVFLAGRENLDVLETAGDFDLLSNFSAGAYHETRHEPMRPTRGTAQATAILNPWPPLADMLWLLMLPNPDGSANPAVDARREYWTMMMGGPIAPYWDVQEVNWSGDMLVDWYAPWQRGQ